MAVDQAYISNIAPKFANVPAPRATALIAIAESQVSSEKWGSQTDYAVALLTLHAWTIGNNNGKGPVTQEKIGDIERSFGKNQGGKDPSGYDLTSWGQEFKRLSRTIPTTPIVTGC